MPPAAGFGASVLAPNNPPAAGADVYAALAPPNIPPPAGLASATLVVVELPNIPLLAG